MSGLGFEVSLMPPSASLSKGRLFGRIVDRARPQFSWFDMFGVARIAVSRISGSWYLLVVLGFVGRGFVGSWVVGSWVVGSWVRGSWVRGVWVFSRNASAVIGFWG